MPMSVLLPETILRSVAPAAVEDHMDLHGLCYCLKSYWRQWPALLPRAMIVSDVLAEGKGSTDVYGLYCHQKACGNPCSMLLVNVMGKGASFSVLLMPADSKLRMRVIEKALVTTPKSV